MKNTNKQNTDQENNDSLLNERQDEARNERSECSCPQSSGSPEKRLECHVHPYEDRMYIKNNTGCEITEDEFTTFVSGVKDVLNIKKQNGYSMIQSVGI